jgi:predicted nucleic acid-binding protein
LIDWVVDASVAAKWCLPPEDEPCQLQAIALVTGFGRGDVRLLVPDLFWAELANVMAKSVRRRRISSDQAKAGLSAVQRLQIPAVPSANLLASGLEIALKHGRSLYDSLYVALAVQASAQLITADERLANALAAYFPVKWLGAL